MWPVSVGSGRQTHDNHLACVKNTFHGLSFSSPRSPPLRNLDLSIRGFGGQRILSSRATGIAFGRHADARLGASGARPPDCLCRALADGVFAHVVAAGLKPDDAVRASVDDRFSVNPGAEALAPIPSRVLGLKHR